MDAPSARVIIASASGMDAYSGSHLVLADEGSVPVFPDPTAGTPGLCQERTARAIDRQQEMTAAHGAVELEKRRELESEDCQTADQTVGPAVPVAMKPGINRFWHQRVFGMIRLDSVLF